MEVRSGYKITEVGVIPQDWGTCKLANYATFKTGPFGSSLHKSDYVRNGIPVINPMQIIDGKLVPTPSMAVSKLAAANLAQFRLRVGDIVIGRRGEMGRCAVVGPKEQGWLCGTGSMIIRTTSHLDGRFLQRVLSTQSVTAAIEKASVGSTMLNLNQATLGNLIVPLPKRYEQEAIEGALSDADALIESLEQLIAKKRDIQRGTMGELLTAKRRLPGFSGEWSIRLLGELIAHCSSGATPYRGRPDFYKGDVKWISSGELTYNVVTDTRERISREAVEKTNLKIHPVGTFLMAITGMEAAGTRGACAIVGSPAATNQSCMAIYPTHDLSTPYLFHYYVCNGEALALQYCQGTKQQSYTAQLVRILPIQLPTSVDEQNAIATALTESEAEIAQLAAKLAKHRQIKEGMIQSLLMGKIRLV